MGAILSNKKIMIAGPAMQDVTAPDRLESSVAPTQHPAPRAAKRFVFSGLEGFTTLRLFNFRSTFAGLFLQLAFQICDISFKTDDPLFGHDSELICHFQDLVLDGHLVTIV